MTGRRPTSPIERWRVRGEDARARIDVFRDELLAGVKRRIRECLGPQPTSIARYYRDYVRTFQRGWERVRPAEVVRRCRAARLVYVGDFHTNPEAQEAATRLLEQMVPGDRKLVLALEMFAAEDQESVDRYLAGEISEAQFLRQIRYQQSWGFRFASYRPLLELAARAGIPVVGINCKRNATLDERDRVAAGRLIDLLDHHLVDSIVVLIGDLHLAADHLPARVEELVGDDPVPTVTVFQNSETIYAELRGAADRDEVRAVRVDEGRYCLLNTPPLVKMQRYLSWLENSEQLLDRETSEVRLPSADASAEESVDVLSDALAAYFEVRSVDVGSFSIHLFDDLEFVRHVSELRGAKTMIELVRDRRVVVAPTEPPSLYLPDDELVTVAAAAMAMLIRINSQDLQRGRWGAGGFFRRILDRALEFLAARLVHPALPGPSLGELWRLAEQSQHGSLPRKLQRRAEVARRLPSWLEAIGSGVPPDSAVTAQLAEDDRRLRLELSRTAGDWLGAGIFAGHRQGRLGVDEIQQVISRVWDEAAARRQVLDWSASYGES